jgi:hypothetical protein
MSHGGMRARSPQTPTKPTGPSKGGALPSGLPSKGTAGAAGAKPGGGMAGMSHGGMRARSPQTPTKPSGAPKTGALPSGMPMKGAGGAAPKGGSGHSHGGA